MKTIENLNNRLNGVIKKIGEGHNLTENETNDMKFQYYMLFGWWMLNKTNEYDNKKIQNLCSAEKVDFFDFVSATVSELSKIVNNGKKEFDFENKSEFTDKEMKRWYYNVDGVAIQKHNKTLAEYTLDLIDYMYVCIKLSDTDNGVVAFEKYIEKD